MYAFFRINGCLGRTFINVLPEHSSTVIDAFACVIIIHTEEKLRFANTSE